MNLFEIYIKTTPERLWEAITDPARRARYSFGVRTESDYSPARATAAVSRASSRSPRGKPGGRAAAAAGAELPAPSGRRVAGGGESRVTWEIEPVGSSCRLRVTHDHLPADANPQL